MADAVKVTLGPGGRNVMLEWAIGYPHITKDGVKVARFIDMIEDPLENMGAQLVYVACRETSKICGRRNHHRCGSHTGLFPGRLQAGGRGRKPRRHETGHRQSRGKSRGGIKKHFPTGAKQAGNRPHCHDFRQQRNGNRSKLLPTPSKKPANTAKCLRKRATASKPS